MLKQFSLVGKTVVITGASSGIGRACAIICSHAGATVVLIGRHEGRLDETLGMMDNPAMHFVRVFDLANDLDSCDVLVKGITAKVGKIHAIIHAAGVPSTLPFRSLNQKHLNEVFQTNVFGATLLTKHMVRAASFCEEGGSIVFITSVMGMVGENAKSVYGMSKGALIAGAKTMALEYADKGIRFNCVSPGVVITPMSMQSEYSKNETAMGIVEKKHPLGFGTPEDVANACVFLVSDASKWITGTNLVVDGGYTSH